MIINVINTRRGNVYSNMMVQLISEDGDIHHPQQQTERKKKQSIKKSQNNGNKYL